VNDLNQSIAQINLGEFCATFGGVCGDTVAISFGGRHVATVFSAINIFGEMGTALFPVALGWFFAQTRSWKLILFLFSVIMAIDALCCALVNPQCTLFGEEHESR